MTENETIVPLVHTAPAPVSAVVVARSDYATIEKLLDYTFVDQTLLERALTHRSVQGKEGRNDYERIEFLGDAVIDLAIAHLLLEQHPDAKEGDLSKMRAALVNTISLASIAKAIDLGPFIRLSRSEHANGGFERSSILADVFEALMGALYREAGFDRALKTIERLFGEQITTVTPQDPKTELQEALHAAGCGAPVYLLELVEGPEHAPTFVSVVKVESEVVGRGKGPTKKASQQEAAAEALVTLLQRQQLKHELRSTGAAEPGTSPIINGVSSK